MSVVGRFQLGIQSPEFPAILRPHLGLWKLGPPLHPCLQGSALGSALGPSGASLGSGQMFGEDKGTIYSFTKYLLRT